MGLGAGAAEAECRAAPPDPASVAARAGSRSQAAASPQRKRQMPQPAAASEPEVKRKPAAHLATGAQQSPTLPNSFLKATLKRYLLKLSLKQRGRVAQTLSSHFSMASACTGTGMAEAVYIQLADLCGASSQIDFSCEKVPFKRGFYKTVVEEKATICGCQFEDLTDLHKGRAQCAKHGQRCVVPSGYAMLACGVSCKTLSRLQGKVPHELRGQILQRGIGCSGQTFEALRGHVEAALPHTFILENVDEIARERETAMDGGEADMDYLYNCFSRLGYVLKHTRMNSLSYGLPQRRVRVFFAGVRCKSFNLSNQEASSLLDKCIALVEKFKFDPEPLHQFLLKPSDPRVTEELRRATSTAIGSSGGDWVRVRA